MEDLKRCQKEADDDLELGAEFMHTYQLTGEAKIVGCLEFIDTLLEAGVKFLLFAHHLSVLDAFEEHIKKKDTDYIRIDGKVPSEKRHQRV